MGELVSHMIQPAPLLWRAGAARGASEDPEAGAAVDAEAGTASARNNSRNWRFERGRRLILVFAPFPHEC
jgi:hypothetical protein